MSGTSVLTLAFLAVGSPLYITVGCMAIGDARDRRIATRLRRSRTHGEE